MLGKEGEKKKEVERNRFLLAIRKRGNLSRNLDEFNANPVNSSGELEGSMENFNV